MNIEQQIIIYLQNKLAEISDVKSVVDGLKRPHQFTEFPALCIVDLNSTSYTTMNSTGSKYMSGGDSKNTEDGWPISIVGYVKTGTDESIQPEIRALQSNIIKKTLENKRMEGLAINTVLSRTTKDISKDKHNNIGSTVCTFNVKYKFEV